MGLSDIAERTWRENILFSVTLELTYRCNLDCAFCYNDVALRGEPLHLDQYRKLLRDLQSMQVMYLTLTGGEPLAHPHFWELGVLAREGGFMIRVKSNGHALHKTQCRRLKREIDPYLIDISLHGARAATHERQTRVAGSFDRLLHNLAIMKAQGLKVHLNCALTRWNEDEVESMYAIADDFGYPLIISPTIVPRDNGDRSTLSLGASEVGLRQTLAIQARRAQRGSARAQCTFDKATAKPSSNKQCGTGSSTLLVDPYGNVYPCIQLRRRLGNLHEQSIETIWMTSPALCEVRDLAMQAKELVEGYGPAGEKMGYCLGLAQAHSGDPLAMYPQARRNLALIP